MLINIGSTGEFPVLFMHFTGSEFNDIMSLTVEFDSFIVNRDRNFNGLGSPLIDAIAARTNDWVEVFGFNAEEIHDAIDNASVRLNRQSRVGDGIPMTSWDYDIVAAEELAEYVVKYGHGVSDYRLVVLIGTHFEASVLLESLRRYRINDKQGRT